jgi:hypothetical protein
LPWFLSGKPLDVGVEIPDKLSQGYEVIGLFAVGVMDMVTFAAFVIIADNAVTVPPTIQPVL